MIQLSAYMKHVFRHATNYCKENGLQELTPLITFRQLIDPTRSGEFIEQGVIMLSEIGGSLELMRIQLDAIIGGMGSSVVATGDVKASAELAEIVESMTHMENARNKEAGGAEFILCTLKHETNAVATLLHSFDINYSKYHAKYYNNNVKVAPKDNTEEPTTAQASSMRIPIIETYSRDLIKEAEQGLLDPVAGREEEIDNVIKVLCRRNKNNPVLVGPAGCGKTAIVEGLAQRIANGDVPQHLASIRIYQLDLTSIMAGTKFRGDFEKRINGIINEAEKYPNIILFMDEIHTMIGAGAGSDDGLDMANILKPALSRGKLSLIGATTHEEFDRTIDRNAAMKRRFDKVEVDEPDHRALCRIITRVLDHCATHYNLKLDPQVTPEFIIELSQYINTSANPDKSIEVIDRAFANVTFEVNSLKGVPEEERAAWLALRYDQRKVCKIDLIYAAALISKIPARFLDVDSERECIDEASKFLNNRIVNQDEALGRVLQVLSFAKTRVNDPDRPRCVEYFDGPEGVGKSEIVHLFAEIVLGSRDKIYRIDLSKFKSEMHMTKLTGAAPGYVGYGEGNNDLMTHIRRNNTCVILLDEIDSCAPEILDFFISMFENGYAEDSRSRKVPINNCYFFLTGNVTSKILRGESKGTLGFASVSESNVSRAMEAIKKRFSKKFMDRIDHITLFNSLNKEDLSRVIDIEVTRMNSYLANIKFSLAETAKEAILNGLHGSSHGARPIRRLLNDMVKPQIADAIKTLEEEAVIEVFYDSAYKWRELNGNHIKTVDAGEHRQEESKA